MAAVLHKDRQLNNLRYCNMWRHLNKFGGGDIQFGKRGEVLDGKILVARVTAGQSVYMTEHAQHSYQADLEAGRSGQALLGVQHVLD